MASTACTSSRRRTWSTCSAIEEFLAFVHQPYQVTDAFFEGGIQFTRLLQNEPGVTNLSVQRKKGSNWIDRAVKRHLFNQFF